MTYNVLSGTLNLYTTTAVICPIYFCAVLNIVSIICIYKINVQVFVTLCFSSLTTSTWHLFCFSLPTCCSNCFIRFSTTSSSEIARDSFCDCNIIRRDVSCMYCTVYYLFVLIYMFCVHFAMSFCYGPLTVWFTWWLDMYLYIDVCSHCYVMCLLTLLSVLTFASWPASARNCWLKQWYMLFCQYTRIALIPLLHCQCSLQFLSVLAFCHICTRRLLAIGLFSYGVYIEKYAFAIQYSLSGASFQLRSWCVPVFLFYLYIC